MKIIQSIRQVKHIKTGNIYKVYGIAINSTNGPNDGDAMVL